MPVRKGQLPPEIRELFADHGEGRTLGVELPEGAAVWPDPNFERRRQHRRPAFWLSDDPVPGELWARLRAEHPESGLWPLLLEESVQPWSIGQIAPDTAAEIDNFRAGDFMDEVWADWVEQADKDQIGNLEPFGPVSPGLAEPGTLVAEPGVVADWYAGVLSRNGTPLGLVAADRGADALAVMGWQGAINHNEWTVPLAAVLRSWEERFGVRVVGAGFNTLELSVAAPPTAGLHALHVAAEHWTFCPDSIIQGPGTLEDYAEQIRGKHAWSFWWD
ncbi:hypothetical protein Aph01nite_21340 [Acrocarpospora phusangensis]|uniref:DUF4253 domain-containing protein n=1 Tax=Acrocarpospora phusangensis TaxID=1070424 RepID=A0A919UJ85_9ACTN|nr:DUF4253 domain-containing protein [Acrocarpospora phusangensis]GIH23824.1 hypothetical protein Aph01nite_21340 [Acrocarpospora phusangensis]